MKTNKQTISKGPIEVVIETIIHGSNEDPIIKKFQTEKQALKYVQLLQTAPDLLLALRKARFRLEKLTELGIDNDFTLGIIEKVITRAEGNNE